MSNLKRVFDSVFVERFAAEQGRTNWTVALDQLDGEALGLPLTPYRRSLDALVGRGLLKQPNGEGYSLTPLGIEACTNEDTLNEALGISQRGNDAQHVQHVTIHGPGQVGNGNVQHVTYSAVLTKLVDQIESAPNLTPEKKRTWTDALRQMAAHPLTQTAIQTAATIGTGLSGQ